ncbi:MAG: hypothetical protein ACYC6F_00740 [Longimicrobiales bacterium]
MAIYGRSRILLRAVSCTVTLLVLAGPSSATAQRLAPDAFANAARPSASLLAPPQTVSKPSAGHLIVGGCLGSVVGILAGTGIGLGLGGEGGGMLGFFGGSVVGSALGVKLAASHEGRGPTFRSALKGALLGTVPGIAAAVILGETIDPWAGLVGFSLAQGTVAGLWARSHTQR